MKIIIGRQLTQEQIDKLPDGTNIFIKEKPIFYIQEGVYTITKDKLINDNKCLLKKDINGYNLMVYEVCVLDEWVELTTKEEYLSLKDGTHVFVEEAKEMIKENPDDIYNCLCIKKGNVLNELHASMFYCLNSFDDNLKIKSRDVKFYVNKNDIPQVSITQETKGKDENNETIYNIQLKVKKDKVVAVCNKNMFWEEKYKEDNMTDKMASISSILYYIAHSIQELEFEQYEQFTKEKWSDFLNGQICLKCKDEVALNKLFNILNNMEYVWSDGVSLINDLDLNNFNKDIVYYIKDGIVNSFKENSHNDKKIMLYQ